MLLNVVERYARSIGALIQPAMRGGTAYWTRARLGYNTVATDISHEASYEAQNPR